MRKHFWPVIYWLGLLAASELSLIMFPSLMYVCFSHLLSLLKEMHSLRGVFLNTCCTMVLAHNLHISMYTSTFLRCVELYVTQRNQYIFHNVPWYNDLRGRVFTLLCVVLKWTSSNTVNLLYGWIQSSVLAARVTWVSRVLLNKTGRVLYSCAKYCAMTGHS